ncbi:UNVERIFIED_ORG: hypothetical protein BDU10_6607 [Burkholderia sp. CF145]|nr:hypothetical protein SAMN05445504_4709 [Burkholderia sp. CF099]
MRLNRMPKTSDAANGQPAPRRRVYAPKLDAPHAPSSTPVRNACFPVTRPSGAPAVTKRIARRI